MLTKPLAEHTSLPELIWRRRNQSALVGSGFAELPFGCPYLGVKRGTSCYWVKLLSFLQVCVFPFSWGVDAGPCECPASPSARGGWEGMAPGTDH